LLSWAGRDYGNGVSKEAIDMRFYSVADSPNSEAKTPKVRLYM